ncbi:MAG: hypothetical protein IMF04_01140 [Proteobacteria bacterium]|nr:hypothetical protein [Pseudomonadota bacterium]
MNKVTLHGFHDPSLPEMNDKTIQELNYQAAKDLAARSYSGSIFYLLGMLISLPLSTILIDAKLFTYSAIFLLCSSLISRLYFTYSIKKLRHINLDNCKWYLSLSILLALFIWGIYLAMNIYLYGLNVVTMGIFALTIGFAGGISFSLYNWKNLPIAGVILLFLPVFILIAINWESYSAISYLIGISMYIYYFIFQITRSHNRYWSGLYKAKLLEIKSKELSFAKNKAEDLQHQAEEANKSKSEFLANMSHELRTPMHGILSFANIGVEMIDTASKEKLALYFSNIQISGDRLLALINDLLDTSKFEAGKMEVSPIESDLISLLNNCQLEQSQRVENLQLSFEVNAQKETMIGFFDPIRIGQVITNLLSNAIKFSPKGGKILVEMRYGEADEIQFSIHDQGVGIPNEELEVIFDPFIQSSKTKTGAGGTGLGLAISRQIINIHHGKIWAENTPHGGAIINFTLPSKKDKPYF